MTAQTPTMPHREVFVRRRLFCLFLPIIVLGMFVFMWASMQTLTVNGLSIAGFVIAAASIITAALDAGERS